MQCLSYGTRPIATKVTYPDGREVLFIERMSKRAAIEQAARLA